MTPCLESFHLGQFPCLWVVIYNVDCVCREFVEKMKVFTQFQTSAELERLQEGLLSESLSVYLSALLGGSLPIVFVQPAELLCLYGWVGESACYTCWVNIWVNVSLSLRLMESFSVSLRPASAAMCALAGCSMHAAWTEILLLMQVILTELWQTYAVSLELCVAWLYKVSRQCLFWRFVLWIFTVRREQASPNGDLSRCLRWQTFKGGQL